ncbi:thermonuclease family protein [bacterium]|nr:thermonuclease family protein [bacterium]
MRRKSYPVISRRRLLRLAALTVAAGMIWLLGGKEALQERLGLTPQAPQPLAGERVRVAATQVRVVDGDTFEIGGRRIRVLGIDTPEKGQLGSGGEDLGQRAKAEAERIVAAAASVEYLPYRDDTYGRLLAHVFVDDRLYAEEIIADGLAWETVSHYGDNGFPELAIRIEKAARNAGQPSFEPPWLWRREHRRGREPNPVKRHPGPSAGGAASAPATP